MSIKNRENAKRTVCRSISWKLSVGVAVPTLAAMLFSACYFARTWRNNSIQQYEQQTKAVFETSITNIDYYLASCISSSKSVYINDALLGYFRQSDKGFTTSGEREMIFSYLKTVYYSISKAKQIFLAIPQAETSFLYITDSLWASTTHLNLSRDTFPEFLSPMDAVIEPTHHMGTYGHVVGFGSGKGDEARDLVFTIWLPIYNLPYSNTLTAYLAIDMPVEFIMENCQLAYDETEKVYITDSQGRIIASSDKEHIHEKVQTLYPSIKEMDQEGFRSLTEDGMLLMQMPMDLRYTDWNILKVVPIDNVFDTARNQEKVLSLTMLGILVAILAVNIGQILYYMIPVKQITSYMSLIARFKSWKRDMSLSDYVTYRGNDEIGILIETFKTMIDTINDYTIREYELELAYTKSTLNMLQAQINPHFIYNTIQCFATSALKTQNLQQYHLISSFGQMLHYAMTLEPSMVPFSRESDYVKRYIELQNMRFDGSGQVRWLISPDADKVMTPRMILQPVVENSFTHGKVFQNSQSILVIKAELLGGYMKISVEDNGIPVSRETADGVCRRLKGISALCRKSEKGGSCQAEEAGWQGKQEDRNQKAQGMGLENVYTRLLLSYGDCDFEIRANDMGGTTTSIGFPVQAVSEQL